MLVARATGWGPAELAAAEAAEVDRLAAALALRADDEQGWQVLLLGDRPSLEELRDELAGQLLARAEPPDRRGSPAARRRRAAGRARTAVGCGGHRPPESSVGAAGAGPAVERPAPQPERPRRGGAARVAGRRRTIAPAAGAAAPESTRHRSRAASPARDGTGAVVTHGRATRRGTLSAGPTAGTVDGLRPPAAGAHASPAVALLEPGSARPLGTAHAGRSARSLGLEPCIVAWPARDDLAAPSARHRDAHASRARPRRSRRPASLDAASATALAEAVAGLLHDEADLRGLTR